MGSLTCLSDPAAVVVADASAVINLNATGHAEAIIRAIPNRIVVVEAVPAELEEGRSKGRGDAAALFSLIAAGLVTEVQLGDVGEEHFESFVIGPASETLDDGEAATLAYAIEHRGVPLIDERKAIRIFAERFPERKLGCTVDVLAHSAVQSALGRSALSEAVYNALQFARMRVLPHHVEWIVSVIGAENAVKCTSLSRATRARAGELSDGR